MHFFPFSCRNISKNTQGASVAPPSPATEAAASSRSLATTR
uniref:Uncharacterized protein n=1 Tax=Arundo donax TaxID=35708 RepID=A0A0A9E0T8_ARUDO